jgi:hypothetical protein
MPRGGVVILSDVRAPVLEITCEPSGRRGRYNVERLIAEHAADARLPELLMALANCAKAFGFGLRPLLGALCRLRVVSHRRPCAP